MTLELSEEGLPSTIVPPIPVSPPKTPRVMSPPRLPGAPDRRGTRLLSPDPELVGGTGDSGSYILSPGAKAAAADAGRRLRAQRESGRYAAGARNGPGSILNMTAGGMSLASHMYNMHSCHDRQLREGQPGHCILEAPVRPSPF